MPVRPVILDYPTEFALVGKILSCYTDLELTMADCISVAGLDFDMVFKVLYRMRGESARVNTANALGINAFTKLGLATEFSMGTSNMQTCTQIRNQYAHCVWYADKKVGGLRFANLEEVANTSKRIEHNKLTMHPITVDLLTEQCNFFDYTSDWFSWLFAEAQIRLGQTPAHPTPKPTQLPPARLRIAKN
jgi:hypothetical protein